MKKALVLVLAGQVFGQNVVHALGQSDTYLYINGDSTPILANRVVSIAGTAPNVKNMIGTAPPFGVSVTGASAGSVIQVIKYGTATCEFSTTPMVSNFAGTSGGLCLDLGVASSNLVTSSLGVLGRTIRTRVDICALCADVELLQQPYYGQMSSALPSGLITLVISGTCAAGWTEVSALSGKTLIGTVAANGDVGTTGGSDTITPAGTNSAPSFTGSSAATSAVSGGTPAGTVAAPTFTGTSGSTSSDSAGTPAGSNSAPALTMNSYTPSGTVAAPVFTGTAGTVPAQTFTGTSSTAIVNHTHNLVSTSFTPQVQGGTTASTTGTHIMTSTAVGGSLRSAGEVTVAATPATGNPASGGVASYTPAGTNGTASFTPTGTIAAPAFTGNGATLTGSVASPTFTGSALGSHSHTLTPAGTNSSPLFTGSALGTHQHTLTATGTVSAPVFSGTSTDNRSAFIKVIFCSKD